MRSSDNNAVAIDGPAGSGKSTVARLVAKALGYTYIDTGAMYRALTLKVMNAGVDMENEEDIIKLSESLDMDLRPVEDGPDKKARVILEGADVTEQIRTMDVTTNVKHVCKIPAVRENLVSLQRQMASSHKGVVMEGRDIGTVVLPDAANKFYLDAGFDIRVERRLSEMKAKGSSVTRQEIAEDLKMRDHTDKTRKVGPLKQADDAALLDTSDMTIDQVVDRIVDIVGKGGNAQRGLLKK